VNPPAQLQVVSSVTNQVAQTPSPYVPPAPQNSVAPVFSPLPVVAAASFEAPSVTPYKISAAETPSPFTDNAKAWEWAKKKRPDMSLDPIGWVSPNLTAAGGGSGAGNVYIGKVLSGGPGPGPYSVNLYDNGPPVGSGSPDNPDATNAGDTNPVSVMIKTLASTETLPAGMWLFNIFQFPAPGSNPNPPFLYFAQPPTWIS
jgi:hypothetical protein